MLIKTRALVLKAVKYGESSLILTMYTSYKGIQQYMISGVGKSKSGKSHNLIRPLNFLDMVAYDKTNATINRIKEYKSALVYQSIPFEIAKSSIGVFLLEVLYKSIRETEENPGLFQFIFDSFFYLDQTKGPLKHFPHLFLCKLMYWQGIGPEVAEIPAPYYFDLRSGIFSNTPPPHLEYLEPVLGQLFNTIIQTGYTNTQHLSSNREQRQLLLDQLLNYYRIHLDGMGIVRSHEIFKEILA